MADRRPCRAAHPEPVTDGRCEVCSLFLHSEKHRKVWTSPKPVPRQRPGFVRPRPGSPPRPRLPVRFCTRSKAWLWSATLPDGRTAHGEEPTEAEAWEEYRAAIAPPPGTDVDLSCRHLLYHVYPVTGNGMWQWNVGELCKRWGTFDGRKVVAIVTDPPTGRKPEYTGPHPPDRHRQIPGCDSAAAVRDAFARYGVTDAEFIELENDPKLREVVSLVRMLERLAAEPGITLYAQAKGTTRPPGHVARLWAEAQYEVYLDYWPLAAEQLRAYPVTGAFKKLGPGWHPSQSKSDWHYSGSWFWFRNADLFARDWRRVDQFWSGIEPYPSQQFYAAEAGCVFHTAAVPVMNLYDQRYWNRVVMPALSQWRKDNEARRA